MSSSSNLDTVVNAIRYSVKSMGAWSTYVADNGVTRENMKSHVVTLAGLAYPTDAPVQSKDGKRTRYGNAVQAAKTGLDRALGKDENASETAASLITAAGKKATREQVIAAWESFQS